MRSKKERVDSIKEVVDKLYHIIEITDTESLTNDSELRELDSIFFELDRQVKKLSGYVLLNRLKQRGIDVGKQPAEHAQTLSTFEKMKTLNLSKEDIESLSKDLGELR